MSNGPGAELAEIIEVDIPRPRTNASLIDDPSYLSPSTPELADSSALPVSLNSFPDSRPVLVPHVRKPKP